MQSLLLGRLKWELSFYLSEDIAHETLALLYSKSYHQVLESYLSHTHTHMNLIHDLMIVKNKNTLSSFNCMYESG